jgi:predicted  nucleic acid-binding Zn-ribbon protein
MSWLFLIGQSLGEPMPVVDDFFRLKEYDSLGREAMVAKSAMEEELARLKRRESELAQRRELLTTREADVRAMNHKMAELDRLLTQRLAPEAISKLEEEGLGILVRQQELEMLIEEDRTFLAGFSATIEDIRRDVDSKLSELRLKEKVALDRQKALAPELPEGWLITYQKIAVKNPAHGVFSRIQSQHCQFCRFAVSKSVESEVDTQYQLKSCSSCGRLFLPYKAVAG